jgi:hypothetical protein
VGLSVCGNIGAGDGDWKWSVFTDVALGEARGSIEKKKVSRGFCKVKEGLREVHCVGFGDHIAVPFQARKIYSH